VAVDLAPAELAREVIKSEQERIGRIDGLLNEAERQLRRYSHELRPTILDDLDWIPPIRFQDEGVSKRASLPIHIQMTVCRRLPNTIETAL
jgi:signal transduction histidine kinase